MNRAPLPGTVVPDSVTLSVGRPRCVDGRRYAHKRQSMRSGDVTDARFDARVTVVFEGSVMTSSRELSAAATNPEALLATGAAAN